MPKNKDPFAERESKKYLKPIPSREFILSYLGNVDSPITLESLAIELKIRKNHFESAAVILFSNSSISSGLSFKISLTESLPCPSLVS